MLPQVEVPLKCLTKKVEQGQGRDGLGPWRLDSLIKPPWPQRAVLPGLRVSENQRFLVTSDGRPFFWLGDTAWELFHRLNREEAELYLENRSSGRWAMSRAQ